MAKQDEIGKGVEEVKRHVKKVEKEVEEEVEDEQPKPERKKSDHGHEGPCLLG